MARFHTKFCTDAENGDLETVTPSDITSDKVGDGGGHHVLAG